MRSENIFSELLNVTTHCARIRGNVSKQATGRSPQEFLFPNGEMSMARYQFWIHDKDRHGQPLDEKILKAAEDIGPSLTRYRHEEIRCEATANEILQAAVEAASKATRNTLIENPRGYITSVYKRFVDKFISHHERLVPVDSEFLEDLANTQPVNSFEEFILNRLLMEKIIKTMDPETRQIFNWKSVGYSVTEIAKELRVRPNLVSLRFTRGMQKVAQTLCLGSHGQK